MAKSKLDFMEMIKGKSKDKAEFSSGPSKNIADSIKKNSKSKKHLNLFSKK